MKGYVSHLITENEKLEQELMADYDAAHAPVSHQQLLALQLRGDIDELSVCIHDCVSLVPTGNNNDGKYPRYWFVVICFHFSIFEPLETTSLVVAPPRL